MTAEALSCLFLFCFFHQKASSYHAAPSGDLDAPLPPEPCCSAHHREAPAGREQCTLTYITREGCCSFSEAAPPLSQPWSNQKHRNCTARSQRTSLFPATTIHQLRICIQLILEPLSWFPSLFPYTNRYSIIGVALHAFTADPGAPHYVTASRYKTPFPGTKQGVPPTQG